MSHLKGDCVLYWRSCACRKMAGMKVVSDDDIVRWIFEHSEVEGEFSDESEHEAPFPVCSDISSSESESSDEEESDDNTQPVTSSWKVYRDGDCDLIKFPYSVTQQGFTLPQNARPKTELEYFQLFFSDDLIGKIVTATNMYAAENIQKVTPLTEYSMWYSWKDVSSEEMKVFVGVILNMAPNLKAQFVDFFYRRLARPNRILQGCFSRLHFLQIFWKEWWKKLFFWLMEVAVVNSYILYSLDKKESGEKLPTHISYKKNLITQLVGNVSNRNSRKRGRPSSSDLEKRLNGKMHFIMQNETKPTKDCIVCSRQNEKRRKDRKHLLL